MGTFNYFVDIDKDVDINVNIDFNVDKFVESFTNIQGYLATAEAAADAFGPGGNGSGTTTTFLIDDFSDPQFVSVFGTNPPNPASDTVSGDDFQGTEIPGVASRAVTMENATGSTSITFAQLGDPFETGAGDVTEFSAGNNSTSDLTLLWTSSVGGFDLLGGADPADAILQLNDVNTDLPVDVEFQFTDSDDDVATVARTVPGEFVGEDFNVPLTDFLVANPVNPGDSPNPDLDFDSIVEIELRILGARASDTVISDVLTVIQEDPPGGGALAETETFAQVDQVSGFTEAFSMSLAATNGAEADIIFG